MGADIASDPRCCHETESVMTRSFHWFLVCLERFWASERLNTQFPLSGLDSMQDHGYLKRQMEFLKEPNPWRYSWLTAQKAWAFNAVPLHFTFSIQPMS
jgi:hypothetical protein